MTLGEAQIEILRQGLFDSIGLYTLLSDVQRNANELRKAIADTLVKRLHHDRPVSGSFGSVQRTTRTNRSLKNDEAVLTALKAAGVDRKQLLGVDREKVVRETS